MSQRDGFTGGFLLGTLVGGVVGGIVGTLVATRRDRSLEGQDESLLKADKREKLNNEVSIEMARRRLENKIAQLNSAIDDVREQLGQVESNSSQLETLTEEV
ncbi:conserved hypothetical protein [Rippkaea orientalis PCC 8801]|uniref:Gas vesicle protein n=1 Tax=Rippkaea orientalis (strain PCC 8801 / RF-1) TaxID=41431 RepID=B7JZM3_RIPO1|nr:hypothetical protein [Rippkaea orientalis]ACK64966.1 conserved hypothetical protein [Rippkaea orientalis PCC 8801]